LCISPCEEKEERRSAGEGEKEDGDALDFLCTVPSLNSPY